MTFLFRRLRRPVAGPAIAALTLGLIAVALQFSSPAKAVTAVLVPTP